MPERGWRVTRRDFLEASGAALFALSFGGACTARRETVRFGLVTDAHYAEHAPAGTRFYRDSLLKMREAILIFNKADVDFVVELGDFKDQDTPPVPETTLGYLKRIEAEFAAFKGARYHVLGNHDMDSISKAQFQSAVSNTGIAPDRTHYAFETKGLHAIVLDANFRSDGVPYDRGDFKWEESNVPATQLDWLKGELSAATGPVIVFVHQRLDGSGGGMYVKNAAAVRAILEGSGKVVAALHGHDHKGGYNLLNGIHYYTLRGMVENAGFENNAYAIAELDPENNLTINGYAKAASLGKRDGLRFPA